MLLDLLDLILYVPSPIIQLKQEWVFLGWTSTKLG